MLPKTYKVTEEQFKKRNINLEKNDYYTEEEDD